MSEPPIGAIGRPVVMVTPLDHRIDLVDRIRKPYLELVCTCGWRCQIRRDRAERDPAVMQAAINGHPPHGT